MTDMETDFDRAFTDLKTRDVALAVASAGRIFVELLVADGIMRDLIEARFRANAGELTVQHEDNAANLLRMIGGVARPQQDE